MEPLRGFIDEIVINLMPTEFNRDIKLSLIELLSKDVKLMILFKHLVLQYVFIVKVYLMPYVFKQLTRLGL